MDSDDKQLAEPTVLLKDLVREIAPNVGRCLIAPGALEGHAFRFSPELSGSALLNLNSRAILSRPSLKVPDVPAKTYMAPFRPESIKDHHLNKVSPVRVVEN